MHRCRCPRTLCGAVVVAIAGCSAGGGNQTAPPPASPGAAAPPERVAVSPAGVTTRVDVPAASTEEEYFQACHAAKTWMQERSGDPHLLIEPYLASIQAPGVSGAGTWNTTWAKLTPARQAAVILAVHAAANDECG
ncbi:lipoprotein LpqV [Mycobacterium shimoidei]|uniref:lipoprotein LpqV n=1 Tax=Mycobacterium shimoidei TaxID=29313 RepID=UPI003CC81D58